jgi:tetratricopeptide (TPR) repeat protein
MITLRFVPVAAVVLTVAAAGYAQSAPVPKLSDEQLQERATKLNELTTNDAMEAKLKELLKDREGAKRLVAVAAKMHADAKEKEKPFKFNAALVLGKLAHVTKDYKAAKTFYTFCEQNAAKLDSEPKLALAVESLLELLWDQKDFDGLIEKAAKLMGEPAESREMRILQNYAVERLIQAKARKGEADEALKMIDGFGKDWYTLQLKGFVLREAGKYDEAAEAYEEAIKLLDDDDRLTEEQKGGQKKRTRYVLTGLYVDDKKVDKAAALLKELMKEDPENPTFPNDLGFIWCDNDMNLEEAERLIRKALELDEKQRKKLLEEKKIDEETAKKRTAAYLDSMGWVLFKNKKYEEAKKYLEEASKDEDEAQHIEIWDHLADCLLALGDTRGAIDTWTKALKFEDVSKRDVERRKKVSQKLQKAKASLKKDDKPEEKKDDKKEDKKDK